MKPGRKVSNMDFDSMKYADLQSLAKELGLKANMKTEKLLKAIKQHYQQNTEGIQAPEQPPTAVEEDENASGAQTSTETSNKEEIFNPPVFVNTRRGKRTGTKRKISDTVTVNACDVQGPGSAEGGAEEASSVVSCGSKAGKKRKVFFAKDGEPMPTGSQQQQQQQQQPGIRGEGPPAAEPEKGSKMPKAHKIPRLQKKHGTPNFKKLHEAHFNQMESIDSYVQRKTRNLEMYKDTAKDSKNNAEKTKLQEPKYQERANGASLLSPAPNRRAAEGKRRHTVLPAAKAPPNKPAGKEEAAFRPSVLSTRRLNIRFSEATQENEHKRSMVKTPARLSPCVASSTPLHQPASAGKRTGRKSAVSSATKTPGPFIFTGNTSTVATPGTQKPKFDLKASLSRPLSYKPHTGKLKPFGDVKDNASANKSLVSVSTHQKNYKQHRAKTREDQRAEQVKDRKQKKEGLLGARRGLVMM